MVRFLLLPAVLVLLCLLSSLECLAQKKPRDKYRHRPTKDTIVVEFGPKAFLAIPVKSVRQFEIDSLTLLLKQLNRDLDPLLDSLSGQEPPITIIYQEQRDGTRRMQVNTKEDVARSELYYVKTTGEVKSRSTPDSIIVERADKRRLFFVLDSLSLLRTYQQQNIDSLIVDIKKEIVNHSQLNGMKNTLIPFGGWLKVTYWDPATRKATGAGKIGVDYSEDFGLGIILGAGVGLVRDKVVPEWGTGVAYRFPRSTAFMGLKFTWHYFFSQRPDESYKMDINTFMSLEGGEKFNSGRGWSLGYLIHRSGNYFKGTTMKIAYSVGTEKIGKLRLVPELIITDNFRVYFPGIRLGVMF